MLKEKIKKFLPGKAVQSIDAALFGLRSARVRSVHRLFGLFGLNMAWRKDYYSPLPNLDEISRTRSRWSKPSELTGVHYDLEAMKTLLSELHQKWGAEFEACAGDYEQNRQKGFGPGYPEFDARILFYFLRDLKPRRYLEIGSGLSTYYASMAARENAGDQRPMQIKCIEPNPYKALQSVPGIEIVQDVAQNVALSEFAALQSGDILFIDSSHVLKVDSDVSYLFLEVLPRLAKGVYIHIHDVPFPFNIPFPPETWMFGERWPVYWNEAMVVQAFLAFNSAFEIALSTPIIRHFDKPYLKSTFDGYSNMTNDVNPFSSLWIKRTT